MTADIFYILGSVFFGLGIILLSIILICSARILNRIDRTTKDIEEKLLSIKTIFTAGLAVVERVIEKIQESRSETKKQKK